MRRLEKTGAARRGRWAVAAVFLVNGFIVGSWAPQIPVFAARLAITESTLGLLILVFGAGAVLAMALCGYLLHRHGSRSVTRAVSLATTFALLAVALTPDVGTAVVTMFLFGALVGAMDVAMNANAVAMERQLGRAVMSSSHGFWSLGGVAGSALGGLAIQQFGATAHALAVTVATFTIIAAAVSFLVVEDRPEAAERPSYSLPRSPLVYLTGIVALFSMIPEGAVLDWAALYLRQELGTDIALASLAFAAFSATMATMRFLGDAVRNRYGAVRTLRVSSLVAAAGMLMAGLSADPYLAIAGFAVAGFGIANMAPIALSAAGNQPGLSSGAGLSTVTLMGYSGMLVAPSAIGFVAERTGFAPIFMTLSLLLIVVAAMSGLVRAADFATAGQPAT